MCCLSEDVRRIVKLLRSGSQLLSVKYSLELALFVVHRSLAFVGAERTLVGPAPFE
jgi:hypothetical protein